MIGMNLAEIEAVMAILEMQGKAVPEDMWNQLCENYIPQQSWANEYPVFEVRQWLVR